MVRQKGPETGAPTGHLEVPEGYLVDGEHGSVRLKRKIIYPLLAIEPLPFDRRDPAKCAVEAIVAEAREAVIAAVGQAQPTLGPVKAEKPKRDPKGPGVSTTNAARAVAMYQHLRGLPLHVTADDLADQIRREAVRRGLEGAGELSKRTLSTLIEAYQEGIRWAEEHDPEGERKG
jgi:hypothetical protein